MAGSPVIANGGLTETRSHLLSPSQSSTFDNPPWSQLGFAGLTSSRLPEGSGNIFCCVFYSLLFYFINFRVPSYLELGRRDDGWLVAAGDSLVEFCTFMLEDPRHSCPMAEAAIAPAQLSISKASKGKPWFCGSPTPPPIPQPGLHLGCILVWVWLVLADRPTALSFGSLSHPWLSSQEASAPLWV